MKKQYEEIPLLLGSTVEQAVNELLRCKEEGKLACTKFNRVTLYSDTVTIDSAYKQITGMSQAEFYEQLK